MKHFISVLGLLLLVSFSASADSITGAVTKVRDGDTFEIGRQAIRLCGIDAPERNEPGAGKATATLRNLVAGKAVRCIPVGEGTVCDDRSKRTSHDRVVAQCFVTGRDIARILVEAGVACDWPRYSGGAYRVIGGCTR